MSEPATTMSELQVRKGAFGQTRLREAATPTLAEGQALVRVDKFALTANNVSYALSADALGYWKFFPAEEPWGIVPVWGFADVVASRCPDLREGERLYGYLPMASHGVLTPGRVSPRGFLDASPHRQGLANAYNAYQRALRDPPELTAIEDQRCLLFPLFATSYILYDYLVDNAFFGAEEVVIASASSKTSAGLARLLSTHEGPRPEIVGLTSRGNIEYVRGLEIYDRILAYDALDLLDGARKAGFVDMSGQGEIVLAIHRRYGENLKLSLAVGATHWDSGRFAAKDSIGARHKFFFAPEQIAKRDQDWGPGEAMRRAQAACIGLVHDLKDATRIERRFGAKAAETAFLELVEGRQSAGTGIIASLSRAG